MNQGTFSSGTITDAAADLRQKWSHDLLGNWTDFQQDGVPDYSTTADNDFGDATDIDQDRKHIQPKATLVEQQQQTK